LLSKPFSMPRRLPGCAKERLCGVRSLGTQTRAPGLACAEACASVVFPTYPALDTRESENSTQRTVQHLVHICIRAR